MTENEPVNELGAGFYSSFPVDRFCQCFLGKKIWVAPASQRAGIRRNGGKMMKRDWLTVQKWAEV